MEADDADSYRSSGSWTPTPAPASFGGDTPEAEEPEERLGVRIVTVTALPPISMVPRCVSIPRSLCLNKQWRERGLAPARLPLSCLGLRLVCDSSVTKVLCAVQVWNPELATELHVDMVRRWWTSGLTVNWSNRAFDEFVESPGGVAGG